MLRMTGRVCWSPLGPGSAGGLRPCFVVINSQRRRGCRPYHNRAGLARRSEVIPAPFLRSRPALILPPRPGDRVDPGVELTGGDVLSRVCRGGKRRSRRGEQAGKLEDPAAQRHQEHHAESHETPVEHGVGILAGGAARPAAAACRSPADPADQHGVLRATSPAWYFMILRK